MKATDQQNHSLSPNDKLARNDGAANSLNSCSTVTLHRNRIKLMLAESESNSPLTPESKQGRPFYAEPADAERGDNTKKQT